MLHSCVRIHRCLCEKECNVPILSNITEGYREGYSVYDIPRRNIEIAKRFYSLHLRFEKLGRFKTTYRLMEIFN